MVSINTGFQRLVRMPNAEKDRCFVVLIDNAIASFDDVVKSLYDNMYEEPKGKPEFVIVEVT